MTVDPGKKFEPTQMKLDELGAALEQILEDLEGLLDEETECETCGVKQASCPDCEQDESHVETEEEV